MKMVRSRRRDNILKEKVERGTLGRGKNRPIDRSAKVADSFGLRFTLKWQAKEL